MARKIPVVRRAVNHALVSVGALSVLLLTLVAFDGRVRDAVRLRLDGGSRASADIVAVGTQARDLADVLIDSVKLQSQQHGPLLIMVVAGSVLTLFMLRT